MEPDRRDRFINSTLSELQEANRRWIFGAEDPPVLTLEEAVKNLQPPISNLMDYVTIARTKSNPHAASLTPDELTAIYLYTMSTSVFTNLNKALRDENRDALKPWFPFLRLLILALEKLPSIERQTLWRGVAEDVGSVFNDGDIHTWWSINSCSAVLNIAELFLNKMGTLFAIEVVGGKDISAFSAFPTEQEIVLLPGTRLVAKSQSQSNEYRYRTVHLKEINPSE